MRRLLALLLAACTAAPAEPEPPAPPPVVTTPPVRTGRSAPPLPPRVLHPNISAFGVRATGDLLVALSGIDAADGLHVLDPKTRKATPWPLTWRPAELGWQGIDHGPETPRFVVSPDGRWVALTIPFTHRPNRSTWDDMQAIVVTRSDATDARCVGVARPLFEHLPLFFTADSARLIARWSIACEPDAHGAPQELDADPAVPRRSFDLQTGATSVLSSPLADAFLFKDPLGDTALVVGQDDSLDVQFYDVETSAELGGATLPARIQRVLAWVQPGAAYVEHDVPGAPDERPKARAVVFTDGRVVPDETARLTIYTRLPNGEVLFNEGPGVDATDSLLGDDELGDFHQGRIDWLVPRVLTSIPRKDLAGHGTPKIFGPRGAHHYTWTPALGGVLIHRVPDGPLELAGL